MRNAMGLWQAIMMILLVSGMMMMVLKYASISAKHISDSYVKEQAELYLNSVIEQALLEISAHDRSSGSCWSGANYSTTNRAMTYSARVNIEGYYLFNDSGDAAFCGALTLPMQTLESHGYVLMNIEVNASVDGELKTRIIRRTLQRP